MVGKKICKRIILLFVSVLLVSCMNPLVRKNISGKYVLSCPNTADSVVLELNRDYTFKYSGNIYTTLYDVGYIPLCKEQKGVWKLKGNKLIIYPEHAYLFNSHRKLYKRSSRINIKDSIGIRVINRSDSSILNVELLFVNNREALPDIKKTGSDGVLYFSPKDYDTIYMFNEPVEGDYMLDTKKLDIGYIYDFIYEDCYTDLDSVEVFKIKINRLIRKGQIYYDRFYRSR